MPSSSQPLPTFRLPALLLLWLTLAPLALCALGGNVDYRVEGPPRVEGPDANGKGGKKAVYNVYSKGYQGGKKPVTTLWLDLRPKYPPVRVYHVVNAAQDKQFPRLDLDRIIEALWTEKCRPLKISELKQVDFAAVDDNKATKEAIMSVREKLPRVPELQNQFTLEAEPKKAGPEDAAPSEREEWNNIKNTPFFAAAERVATVAGKKVDKVKVKFVPNVGDYMSVIFKELPLAPKGPQTGAAQKEPAQKASLRKAASQKEPARKAPAQKASLQKAASQKEPAKKGSGWKGFGWKGFGWKDSSS